MNPEDGSNATLGDASCLELPENKKQTSSAPVRPEFNSLSQSQTQYTDRLDILNVAVLSKQKMSLKRKDNKSKKKEKY